MICLAVTFVVKPGHEDEAARAVEERSGPEKTEGEDECSRFELRRVERRVGDGVARPRQPAEYARPGRMAAGFAYLASFQKTAVDFAELAKTRLSIPVLSIGGAKANGVALGAQVKLIASDVTVIVLPDTGHWVMEERPQETITALDGFLK